MLIRLYIDNYRALVNCEITFESRSLLMGRNGSGKSTFGEVLVALRMLLSGQAKTDDLFPPQTLTRWQNSPKQKFEVDVTGPHGLFEYQVTVEHQEVIRSDRPRTRITNESLRLNDKPLFLLENDLVHLFSDDHAPGPEYPFGSERSGLAMVGPRSENTKLTWFRNWFGSLAVLKPNPQQMDDLLERDDFNIVHQGAANFAAWYHAASAVDKRRDQMLHKTLSEVMPGFEALNFEPAGPGRWLLRADFVRDGKRLMLRFNELSDGQRALILLYAIHHFLLDAGQTVMIDEPDNFVSLDEIQPWLLSSTDLIDDGKGQLILISHHPEIFNQWAVNHGIVTDREGCGPVRVKRFADVAESGLPPSEIIARGWVSGNGDDSARPSAGNRHE